MIKSTFYLAPGTKLPQQVEIDQVSSLLATGKGLLWIDIEDTTSEDAQFLIDLFRFHPLAVADCVSKNIHPPKIDQFEDHLFIIVHGINYHVETDVVETTELSLFLGKNYVVTSHDIPMRSVTSTIERLQVDGHPMRRGALISQLKYELGEVTRERNRIMREYNEKIAKLKVGTLTLDQVEHRLIPKSRS